MVDHLSRIKEEGEEKPMESPIDHSFPDEFLYASEIFTTPWYTDKVNYLVCCIIPSELSYQRKKKFISDENYYQLEDSLLYKHRAYQIVRRCILEGDGEYSLPLPHEGGWWTL